MSCKIDAGDNISIEVSDCTCEPVIPGTNILTHNCTACQKAIAHFNAGAALLQHMMGDGQA
jgi:hypothetical protein